jgi:glutathione S-transferase
MTKPRLITFGRSHFCEKARWALDWHGIAYDEIGWPPGLHIILAKRCGAKTTTLFLSSSTGKASFKEAARSSTGQRASPRIALEL